MSIFSRLKDFVGLGDPVDYDYDYDEAAGRPSYPDSYGQAASEPGDRPVAPDPARRARGSTALANLNSNLAPAPRPAESPRPGPSAPTPNSSPTSSNVIGMPGAMNGLSEVVVMEPRSFEEMPQAIQALRERKSVVLNLTMMDPDQAQRSVDFIAGGTYALDGHQERIGESIFLFTPSCVQVSTQSGLVREVFQAQARAAQAQAQAAWSGGGDRFAPVAQ